MSKKVNHPSNEQEPWAHKFAEDDLQAEAQYSRAARSAKKAPVAPLSSVLAIIFVVLIVVPIMFMIWIYYSETQSVLQPRTADEVMYSKSSESASLSIVESIASSSIASSSSAESSSSSSVASSNSQVTQSVSSSSQTTTQAPQGYKIYVVKAGDNPYRIAVNHGMDPDEFLRINGLEQGAIISVGMELKVAQ